MVEGFWICRFQAQQFTGGGVALFTDGKIYGGDNGFTWVGTYAGDNRLIKGRVTVHNFDPDVQSIFQLQGDYEMYFSVEVQGDTMSGTAMITGQPQHSLGVQMIKRANL